MATDDAPALLHPNEAEVWEQAHQRCPAEWFNHQLQRSARDSDATLALTTDGAGDEACLLGAEHECSAPSDRFPNAALQPLQLMPYDGRVLTPRRTKKLRQLINSSYRRSRR